MHDILWLNDSELTHFSTIGVHDLSTETNTRFFMNGSFYGGIAAGVVLISALGFNWIGDFGFNWVLGSDAQRHAEQAVENRLAQMCVARAQQDPDGENLIAALKKESSWKQDDFVADHGWSTFAPSEEPASGVATVCAKELVKATT